MTVNLSMESLLVVDWLSQLHLTTRLLLKVVDFHRLICLSSTGKMLSMLSTLNGLRSAKKTPTKTNLPFFIRCGQGIQKYGDTC